MPSYTFFSVSWPTLKTLLDMILGQVTFFFAACFSGQVQVGQVPFFRFACLVGQVGVGQVRSLSFVTNILYVL